MAQSRTRLAHYIAEQTLNGADTQQLSREIAAYLLDEGDAGELDSLLRDVQAAWAEQGHVEVLAASAHPLTDEVKTDITRQVQTLYPAAKTVVVTEVHDPSVIGGVRLSLAHQQLDLSVEAKLNKFKQLTTAGKE